MDDAERREVARAGSAPTSTLPRRAADDRTRGSARMLAELGEASVEPGPGRGPGLPATDPPRAVEPASMALRGPVERAASTPRDHDERAGPSAGRDRAPEPTAGARRPPVAAS